MSVLDPHPSEPGPAHVSPCAHAVRFYEDDDVICDAVADFLAAGWLAGEPTVLIATPAHRDAIVARLDARGIDLGSAWNGTFCDARETLEAFMVGGRPDPRFFRATMQRVFRRVDLGGRRVRAFGEMVDLLARDGNEEGALLLEDLWNDFARTRSFTLLCAYSVKNRFRETNGGFYREVCDRHSQVFPHARVANG